MWVSHGPEGSDSSQPACLLWDRVAGFCKALRPEPGTQTVLREQR